MRLIDAGALIDKAWDAENGFGWVKVVSVNDVMTAPTIDAVEVVRCRDCKYSRPYRTDKYTCEKEHDCGDYTIPADWFCADGKRREEG